MGRKKSRTPPEWPQVAEKIVGHETPLAFLRSVVRRKRVAHAHLFSGPDGVGKRTAAFHFARMLLGEDRLEANPHFFFVTVEEGKKNISIRQVADLHRALALKPLRPRPRIVVIDDAHLLSEDAMNALLKTLEEPPLECVFVLVTAVPSALLPTILSRCHALRFGPVPEDLVRDHLVSAGWEPRQAALAARLTGGRIGHALAGAEDIAAAREKMDETLAHVLRGSINPVVEALTRIRDPQKSRREATLVFDLLLLALRETFRARISGEAPDPDVVPERAARAFEELDENEILERLDLLLDHRRFLDLNANVGLTVENALIRI